MLKYIKKQFERPENGLMQIILTHMLVFVAFFLLQIINKLTGFVDLSKIYSYLHLSSSGLYLKPWTLLTYGFIHQRIGSLISNLLALYSFGRVVVYLLGNRKFLKLYFAGSILGGLTFVLSYNLLPYFIKFHRTLHHSAGMTLVGSSTALYAIIIGIATFAPDFNFSFTPFLAVKAKHLALVFLLWPLLSLSYTEGHEAVDIARLGGALAGYVYIKYLLLFTNRKWRMCVNRIYLKLKKKHQQFTKKIRGTREEDAVITADDSESISNEELEAILDKIALYGYQKLTQEEKRQLFNAGKN